VACVGLRREAGAREPRPALVAKAYLTYLSFPGILDKHLFFAHGADLAHVILTNFAGRRTLSLVPNITVQTTESPFVARIGKHYKARVPVQRELSPRKRAVLLVRFNLSLMSASTTVGFCPANILQDLWTFTIELQYVTLRLQCCYFSVTAMSTTVRLLLQYCYNAVIFVLL
jgi:hypothetical protein